MLKPYLFIILIAFFGKIAFGQQVITGQITSKPHTADTVFFNTGNIEKKFYENPFLTAKLNENRFKMAFHSSYPQMFRMVFGSDKDKRVWRLGVFFVDNATTRITSDYLQDECINVDGPTAKEYSERFIPFLLNNKTYRCESNEIYEIIENKNPSCDSIIYKYVQLNPKSYVALWMLIERYSQFGHSELRQAILVSFDSTVKKSKLWRTMQIENRSLLIKEKKEFPLFDVQTPSLQHQLLKLPVAKYTLVDFWFSRCKPCLDTIPSLKKIYEKYHKEGFEILSISTDKSKDVPIWQKRIGVYEIPWIQFLDENARYTSKLKIFSFPTTFLLDADGRIIKRDLSSEELEVYLSENL